MIYINPQIRPADPTGCQVLHRQFIGDRTRIRQFVTQMALDVLRRKLM